jgi:hypothetical protein
VEPQSRCFVCLITNAPIAFQLLNYDYDTTARTGSCFDRKGVFDRAGAESSLQMGPATSWSSYWSSSTLVARKGFISLFSYSPQCRAGKKNEKDFGKMGYGGGVIFIVATLLLGFRNLAFISADKRHRF